MNDAAKSPISKPTLTSGSPTNQMLDAPRATRPIKFVAAIRARSPTNTSMSKSMPLPMKNGCGLVTCHA